MAASPTLPFCPIPPYLRITRSNKADDYKDEPKPSGLDAEGGSCSTVATGQENRRTMISFAPGTNPPPRSISPNRRMTPANELNEKEDQPKATKSGEEGDYNSTASSFQESRRPTIAPVSLSSPPLRPISPKIRNMPAGEADEESKASISGEDGASSLTVATGQEDREPIIPTTSRMSYAVLANDGHGNLRRNRTPSPQKRRQEQIEKTIDSEYRRDLLGFEGIAVIDFQLEADAHKEDEGSPKKKKGKTAASYESPARPLVLRGEGRPPEDNVPVRDLRARVIAQMGFATHFERADDDLEEEDLYAPEVGHIMQDDQRPLIIPIRDGSRAQYPVGSTADRVGAQLRERRRERMILQRARVIGGRNEEGRKRLEALEAKAAAEAHDAALALAEALANDNEEEDEEEAGDPALHQCLSKPF